MNYAGIIDVNVYVKRNFAPMEDRVGPSSLSKIRPRSSLTMQSQPGRLIAKPYVETAIQICRGSVHF